MDVKSLSAAKASARLIAALSRRIIADDVAISAVNASDDALLMEMRFLLKRAATRDSSINTSMAFSMRAPESESEILVTFDAVNDVAFALDGSCQVIAGRLGLLLNLFRTAEDAIAPVERLRD